MASNDISRGLQSYILGMTEEQAIRTLKQEGKRLEAIVRKVWRKWQTDYRPEVYIRTGKTERGIKLGRVKRIDGNSFGIELTFENSLMYHDSYISKSEPKGHSFMLISEGWKVRKGKHRDVYMFGYFEGADLIGQIVKEYNKFKPRGITLETQWSGKALK